MDFAWVSDVSNTRKHPTQAKATMPSSSTTSPPPVTVTAPDNAPNYSGGSSVAFSAVDQPTLRRPRADTMPTPTFPYGSDLYGALTVPPTNNDNNSATRHRSGSVTLPSDRSELHLGSSLYSPFEPTGSAADDSASSTVASTLASLGLDDDQQQNTRPINHHRHASSASSTSANALPGLASGPYPLLHHHHQQQHHHNDTSGESLHRSRAYTVAGRGPLLERPDFARTAVPFNPFSPQTRSSVMQRPRAVSLGMADDGPSLDPPPSSLAFGRFDGLHGQRLQQPSSLSRLSGTSSSASSSSSEAHRTLRGSRSSGNLVDLTSDIFGHRGFGRMGSQTHLTNLPEMTATEDFYGHVMDPSTSTPSASGLESPSSAAAQIPSRALWLGNINPSLSVPDLMQLFGDYGHVESARILSDKECAFVNFTTVESAVAAKNDLETRFNSTLAGTPVRVGFGKADVSVAMALTNEAGPNAQGPTRALWVGNIPANMNPAILRTIFQPFGLIDSVRVLSHKNCGFVNFEHQEDAVRARKTLQNKEILGPGTGAVRIGFAKVPSNNEEHEEMTGGNASNNVPQQSVSPDAYQATQWATAMMMSNMISGNGNAQGEQPSLFAAIQTERKFIMEQLGYKTDQDVFNERPPSSYCSLIPAVPELGPDRKLEPLRLREMRKRLDNGQMTLPEIEAIASECADEIVELCSDYIGNTVVQRIFENCSDETKQGLLERIAPHLASIGVHKNGTWAAQKIIDYATTPSQIELIRSSIAPYVPLLLLDQFGNYVVQCCLQMGAEENQFIFDTIVEKCWEIGQGRFGARAIRAILENSIVTPEQQIYAAAAIVQNAVLLTTNANGMLLLIWYLDTANLPGRYRVLVPRLLPYLSKLCTHKQGSMTVLKVIQQEEEPDARNLLVNAIFSDTNLLDEILRDQVHGVNLIQKILNISDLEKRPQLSQRVKESLTQRLNVQHVQSYKKLFEQLGDDSEITQANKDDGLQSPPSLLADKMNQQEWMQNPQTVAMMANMYAAAMTAAATSMNNQPQQGSPQSGSSKSAVDLSQFDQILKQMVQKPKESDTSNECRPSEQELQDDAPKDKEKEEEAS